MPTSIRMYYEDKDHPGNKNEVLVYDFHLTDSMDCLLTAYDIKNNIWITAPVYYFEPILNKEDLDT